MNNTTNKIFFIGMNRTGTLSYYNFLIKNNIKSIHQRKDKTNKKDYGYWYETSLDYFKDHRGYLTSFEHYLDNEIYLDLNFLDINFPRSKFILNTRNLDEWLLSRLNHNKPSYYKSNKKSLDDMAKDLNKLYEDDLEETTDIETVVLKEYDSLDVETRTYALVNNMYAFSNNIQTYDEDGKPNLTDTELRYLMNEIVFGIGLETRFVKMKVPSIDSPDYLRTDYGEAPPSPMDLPTEPAIPDFSIKLDDKAQQRMDARRRELARKTAKRQSESRKNALAIRRGLKRDLKGGKKKTRKGKKLITKKTRKYKNKAKRHTRRRK